MSQWSAIQQLNSQVIAQVKKLYSEASFPIEVRHFFAQWIEDQPWKDLNEDQPEHHDIALQLLNQLLVQLKEKCVEFHEDHFFFIRIELQEAESNFTQFYGNNPFAFIKTVRQLLDTEASLLQTQEPQTVQEVQMNGLVPDTRGEEITQALEVLKNNTLDTDNELRILQSKQESFIIQYQESTKLGNFLKQIQLQVERTVELQKREEALKKQKEEVETNLAQKAQELLQLRILIAKKYSDTVNQIDSIQKNVLDDELIQWKRRQQHVGEKFEENLDQLQKWCEDLADLNWSNRQQIQRCRQLEAQLPIELPAGQENVLPGLGERVTCLLSTLVTSTFIVSNQPPQVLKKDSRFSAAIRLLVGGKLNVHMTPPTVRATIISEKQAQELLGNNVKVKNETSGEILNNNGTMDYESESRKLGIMFRNMQLKRIKRADRKSNEAVTEEKFCILFQSDFKVGGNELVFQVWTLSLPVVVIVHGNQECNAHATILWDNAFSEPGRVPFHVPDQVMWPQLKEQLDLKFKAITGRGLTEDHLNYLATKLLDGQLPTNDDFSACTVSWSLFNKEQVKGRSFTFWEWLHAVAKLTKEHLKGPWNDGSVIGFVSKSQAQDWLFQKPNGTFLLRFSDSEPGGITIAWVDDKANGKLEVWNLKPFGAKDFSIRSLADRIKDLHNLVYLYPDIPKENAFGKYFSSNPGEDTPNTDGYIKPNLMTVIPGHYNGQPMNLENPQTPQTPQLMEPFSPTTSATSVYDKSPGSVLTQQTQDDPMQGDLEDFYLFSTDYAPEDIQSINVNELIYQTNNT
ncbi:signal transducer and activator of transcription 5B-like [Gigantopelta aegis]|uniref:signal transducer and activator of transcription 5B-like n=1 Tax=Gigantopelta aegis TaxID=1735272 RepID=UPI001B88C894|nr:signal transducer and activator of transcription 5B-like [Gigantopelta aegis]